jgi:hypothetical protein
MPVGGDSEPLESGHPFQVDWVEKLELEYWTLEEFSDWLFCGYDINVMSDYAETDMAEDAYERIDPVAQSYFMESLKRAVEAGKLKPIGESDNKVTPTDIIEWCMQKESIKLPDNLLEALNAIDDPKPLHLSERKSLLTIIGALCKSKKMDLSDSATTGKLCQILETKGHTLDRKTVKKHLDNVRELFDNETE